MMCALCAIPLVQQQQRKGDFLAVTIVSLSVFLYASHIIGTKNNGN
jgi:hypothetical protein